MWKPGVRMVRWWCFQGIWGQAIRLCCLIRSRQSGQIICLLKPLMAISSTRMCRAEGSGCAR
ncbi:Uncharacterised protein [Vibrio cholerae]|nr:Uncharacterised protein [Vibrio cholerae]